VWQEGRATPQVGGAFDAAASRFNTEAYDHIEENRFRRVDADPLSTFSIDVDTAS
jgi:Ca-activated chloride channel family protein